jgi:hypothetical protein
LLVFFSFSSSVQSQIAVQPNPPHKASRICSAFGLRRVGNRSDENKAMNEAVQEAKLLRQVNALIVAHLRSQNLGQAAAAVAAATMTPISAAESVPANHLLRLVAKVPPFSPSSCLVFVLNGPKPSLLVRRASPRSTEEVTPLPHSTPPGSVWRCSRPAPVPWISGKPQPCAPMVLPSGLRQCFFWCRTVIGEEC